MTMRLLVLVAPFLLACVVPSCWAQFVVRSWFSDSGCLTSLSYTSVFNSGCANAQAGCTQDISSGFYYQEVCTPTFPQTTNDQVVYITPSCFSPNRWDIFPSGQCVGSGSGSQVWTCNGGTTITQGSSCAACNNGVGTTCTFSRTANNGQCLLGAFQFYCGGAFTAPSTPTTAAAAAPAAVVTVAVTATVATGPAATTTTAAVAANTNTGQVVNVVTTALAAAATSSSNNGLNVQTQTINTVDGTISATGTFSADLTAQYTAGALNVGSMLLAGASGAVVSVSNPTASLPTLPSSTTYTGKIGISSNVEVEFTWTVQVFGGTAGFTFDAKVLAVATKRNGMAEDGSSATITGMTYGSNNVTITGKNNGTNSFAVTQTPNSGNTPNMAPPTMMTVPLATLLMALIMAFVIAM
eukprot:TRINITY_DN1483_c0_g1_i2.p1 TRINITY_DN1483_c0_g1~~TRINITY_DN1483_c0_g1_i2.p1  ORF type:complete len:411 (+),score=120.42 TRINITY_DN1483_c0_g1_i2:210-1442(+)